MERLRFFERRQILALQVLDERELQHLGVVGRADHRRQFPQADLYGRLIPPLARHDLEPAATLTHQQRFENPLLGNRRDQLREVAHHLARLVRVGIEQLDRDHAADGRAGGGGQRLHVMLVMPHPQRLRQSALRHVQSPLRRDCSNPLPPTSRART